MMATLMWEIHVIRSTVLRSIAEQHSRPSKIEITEGIDHDDVDTWFFELYDFGTRDDLSRFCQGMAETACHLATSGQLKK